MKNRIFLALALVASALVFGGCAHRIIETVNVDGSKTVTEETTYVPSPYVRPLVMVPLSGYDHRYYQRRHDRRTYSYGSRVPMPAVAYGSMVTGTIRAVVVDGEERLCDIRPQAPNHCGRLREAYGWPRR